MDVEYFKDRFKNLETGYLLEKRIGSSDLNPNAQKAIEEILAARGEQVPPVPSRPIDLGASHGMSPLAKTIIAVVLVNVTAWITLQLTLGMFSAGFMFHHVTLTILSFFFFRWYFRRQSQRKQVELPELMRCSADGDFLRAKELLDYKVDVNARSRSGNTALMYAARNGHLNIVKLLLESGADPSIKSNRGLTAVGIADELGHVAISNAITASSEMVAKEPSPKNHS